MNKNIEDLLGIKIKGHVRIEDDLGNILLDKDNDIHPRNFSRIIARALIGQENSMVYRMAFGNGGAIATDSLYTVTLKTPNTGQDPDTTQWRSRLYNEIYSKLISTATSRPNRSNLVQSVIELTVVLAPDEPRNQSQTDNLAPSQIPTEPAVFNEIGLYTSGAPPTATHGVKDIFFNNPIATGADSLDVTTVSGVFELTTNPYDVAPTYTTITLNVTNNGNNVTYNMLKDALNAAFEDEDLPILASFEYGVLTLTNTDYGSISAIDIKNSTDTLFVATQLPTLVQKYESVAGSDAGVEDNAASPELERERLLTHIIFNPILKSSNRTFVINYTLTIGVS